MTSVRSEEVLRCEKCNIKVGDPRSTCPLCQNRLVGDSSNMSETFPEIPTVYSQFRIFFKILIFLSIVGGGASVAVNLFIWKNSLWSAIVLVSIVYFWSTLITAVRRKYSVSKKILYQVIVLSILVLVIDLTNDYSGWSVNYVIPAIQSSAMLSITTLAFVQRFRVGEYIIHLVVSALLGFIPLALMLVGWVGIFWPSLTCVVISIICIVAVAVFGTRETKDELEKRFHI